MRMEQLNQSDLQHRPFPKIGRFYDQPIEITEKIDGTNALIRFDDSGRILVGSRNRWLSPGRDTDNYGFAEWAHGNQHELFNSLGPGYHYGEWFGNGINRGYGLHQRELCLFEVPKNGCLPDRVGVVPKLYVGKFSEFDLQDCLGNLAMNGSVAVPKYMNPEGVVIRFTRSRERFKVILNK